MQAPSGQMTGPALQALLKDGALAGEWALDPRTSSIRLQNRSMGLVRVNGVFREVSGHGTVSPGGEVSGAITVAAASIDTKNTRRDTHLRSADFFDSAEAIIGAVPRRRRASPRRSTAPLGMPARRWPGPIAVEC